MRIVGIDPGETTGFVDVRLYNNGNHVVVAKLVTWENRFTLDELIWGMPITKFDDFSPPVPPPDAVVVESFRLYAHAAANQINHDFPSVRIIGIVETVLNAAGCLDRLFFQPASIRQSVQIPEEVKETLGSSPHTQDAYCHVRYFVITKLKRRM